MHTEIFFKWLKCFSKFSIKDTLAVTDFSSAPTTIIQFHIVF